VGSGTTLVVAERLNRSAVGIDINDNYEQIIRKRINTDNARLEKWF
jgi:DNA modification methylase